MTEIFRNNLGLKLFSLLLAVLLEFYFYSPDNSIRASFSSAIEIQNVPQDQMVTSPSFGKVDWFARLTIRGPAPLVQQVVTSPPRVLVPIPADAQEVFKLLLTKDLVKLPSGVELLESFPQAVEFRVHKRIHKRLNVTPKITGEVPEGYRLEGVTANPASVVVSGPLTELEAITDVETEEISIEEVKGRKRISVALKGVSQHSELRENMVEVEVRVPPSTDELTIDKVSVRLLAPAGFAATLEPSNVKVVVGGPVNSMQGISAGEVELTVDATSLTAGVHMLAIGGTLPKGLRIIRTEPETVKVVLVSKNG